MLQRTFGWAWRKSTALLSTGFTSCVLIWRTGRRRNTGLSINSHWMVLPKTTSFKSVTFLVICLMLWPTALAWGSLQKTEMTMITETPAIKVIQVDSQSIPNILRSRSSPIAYVFLFDSLTGGWWVNACGETNLNGRYQWLRAKGRSPRRRGIHWRPAAGPSFYLKTTKMTLQPAQKSNQHWVPQLTIVLDFFFYKKSSNTQTTPSDVTQEL